MAGFLRTSLDGHRYLLAAKTFGLSLDPRRHPRPLQWAPCSFSVAGFFLTPLLGHGKRCFANYTVHPVNGNAPISRSLFAWFTIRNLSPTITQRYSRNCQTLGASPAEPGGLSFI